MKSPHNAEQITTCRNDKYMFRVASIIGIIGVLWCSTVSAQLFHGQVRDTYTKLPLQGATVYLTFKCLHHSLAESHHIGDFFGRYHKLDSTTTDSAGNYSLLYSGKKEIYVIAAYKLPPLEKLGGAGLSRTEIDSTSLRGHRFRGILSLRVSCPYDNTKDRKTCPKCNKSDRVQPVFIGVPTGDFDEEKYYYLGCLVDIYCHPTKHCRRCNKDF